MRLRRPEEFRRVWAAGRSWAHAWFILWALPNDLDHVRVGITASRKVGNAVARNRARRLLREATRHLYPHIVPGWDLVLVARPALVTRKEPQVESALQAKLNLAELWTPVTEDDAR
jgi:ribonuclease P protein component